MRILYVISELRYGGAEKQVVELAKELARRGHEVTIYTLSQNVPRQAELLGSSVRLIVDAKQSRIDLAVLRRLRHTIASWQPDIVHGFLFDGDIYARIAACGSGTTMLSSERSCNYRLSFPQIVGHLLTRHVASGLVANTYAGRDFAQRRFTLRPDHMHVVWNGINLSDLKRKAEAVVDHRTAYFGPGRHRIACMVATIAPSKDYHLALDVAARLIAEDPSWRVLLIGDKLSAAVHYRSPDKADTGAYKDDVLRHYRQLGLSDKIKFAWLRTDVPAIMRQCDVFYATFSQREGFPNVVLEAMALGVPVASTEYSDIRRILPFPWQVVASRAPEDIAATVIRAYGQRQQVAAAQRRWVEENATIQTAAAHLEEVYYQYVRREATSQLA